MRAFYFFAFLVALQISAPDGFAQTAADFEPFKILNGADHVIALDGPIDFRAPLAFRRIMSAHPDTKGVLLNSVGGSVQAALLIAEDVYEKKLATIILPGTECMSACSFIFFAGDARLVGGRLGVHQMSGSTDLKNAQLNLSDVLETLAKYGVGQDVITRMLRTPPESMYVFSKDEVVELGINRDGDSATAVSPPVQTVSPSIVQATPPAKPVNAEEEEDAKKFVLNLIAAGSLSKASLIDLSGRVYGDEVEFYGKKLSRREILGDKARYADKWPVRSSMAREKSITSRCIADECRVSGIYDWTVSDPRKNKTLKGSAVFEYQVRVRNGAFVVTAEDGRVVERTSP